MKCEFSDALQPRFEVLPKCCRRKAAAVPLPGVFDALILAAVNGWDASDEMIEGGYAMKKRKYNIWVGQQRLDIFSWSQYI